MVSGYQHNNLTAPHLDISGAHAQPNKTTAVSQMLMFLNMSAQLQCLGMTCFWLPTANHEKTHRVSVILFSTQPSSRDTDAITLVSSISGNYFVQIFTVKLRRWEPDWYVNDWYTYPYQYICCPICGNMKTLFQTIWYFRLFTISIPSEVYFWRTLMLL